MPDFSKRALALGAAACAFGGTGVAAADVSSTPDRTWVVAGVSAIERAGDVVFLGGGFSRIGPRTGSAVPTSAATGEPDLGFPEIVGTVRAAVPDGAGGWFIGGRFQLVGGVARRNLVHVRADNSVDPAFDPSPDDHVLDLELRGDSLYVAGTFQQIAGTTRPVLAAVNRTTGSLLPWNPAPQGTNGAYADAELAVAADTIYVGGDFDAIGGAPHIGMAAVDPVTGSARPWASDVVRDTGLPQPEIYDVEAVGDTVYVAGTFQRAAGQPRNNLAAFDTAGKLRPWDPRVDGPELNALAVSGQTVYLGGRFDTVGGVPRASLAAVDATTGEVRPWDPHAGPDFPYVLDLAVGNGAVYAAGTFAGIGGHVGGRAFAALDPETGRATEIAWDPVIVHGTGEIVVPDGDRVLVGGRMASVGAQQRRGLAALDVDTGEPLPFDPQISFMGGFGSIGSIARVGQILYVGGYFDTIDGQPRAGLAAFELPRGTLTGWAPQPNGPANVLAARPEAVYVGGQFETVGGVARKGLAALDPVTGAPTAFDARVDADVLAAAPVGPYVYIGGLFDTAGGSAREGLALLRAADGDATCWDAGGTSGVGAIELAGDRLYVGGYFGSVGGHPRTALAALDADSGDVLPWDAGVELSGAAVVTALEAAGPTLYVGGAFERIGGADRTDLAAVSTADARATGFAPGNPSGAGFFPRGHAPGISALLVGGDGILHTGGYHGGFATVSAPGYAQFRGSAPAGPAADVPQPECRPEPKPARIGLRVRNRSLGRAVRRGLAVRVSVSHPGTARVRLYTSRREARRVGISIRRGRTTRTLAIAKVPIGEAGTRAVRMRLSRGVRGALADNRRLRVSIEAHLRTPGSQARKELGFVLRR